MLKKQIILSCIESKNYNKTGIGSYVCGDFEYHVENVNGEPKVTSVTIPSDFNLDEIQVIIRK